MVFESLVVELINKYLGDFVENLNSSQLKIGIWGGDVVLANLDLKQSALDDLNLPVKIKTGHIGKLTLKIPWKNLYSEPVIAQVDGLYALVVPNMGIKYSAVKEEKEKQESKQKKLKNIEEAKKIEAEKDKPKQDKKDTFAEKFATQVIKNLQIRVSNVHIRYEDAFTNPKKPFTFGVTLQGLLFQTTDENWNEAILKEAVTQIYKLVRLDSLAVYWNSNMTSYDQGDKDKILDQLKINVTKSEGNVLDRYLVNPISSVAHLKLHTKPEIDNFTISKIMLTIVFDQIGIELTKLQYNDILEMLESFERMALLGIYRKYRPDVPPTKHSKQWWLYAYESVLNETVRRRRKMWSIDNIMNHRRTMKAYRAAYIKKLDGKKISGDLQKIIEESEKQLDVLSITLMRQQAEVEAAKLGAKRAEEKSSGWFGGIFGGKKKKADDKASAQKDIQDQFAELYTLEEKSKLYSAIGYEENEADLSLPKEYVALRLVVKLNGLTLALKDENQKEGQIVKIFLKDVFTSIGQRPAANSIQVQAKMDQFQMIGTPQAGRTPQLATSQNKEADKVYSLLDVMFETNPLDGKCDTRVHVNSRPLEIVYDAITINKVVDFFKPPESVYLKQLSQAAMSKFEEIKEQSVTGLQYAIEQRKYTEILVDLKPSYIIIPHKGIYHKDASLLVVDLGNLKVNSEKYQTSGKGKMETVDEVLARAYDKFNIQLDNMLVIFSHRGENWQAARKSLHSPMHILRPLSIKLVIQKCMFDNDVRMAKMKLSGELPLLSLSVSDQRLKELIKLGNSIPLPEAPTIEQEEVIKGPNKLPTAGGDSSAQLLNKAKIAVPGETPEGGDAGRSGVDPEEYVNYTDVEVKFEIKEFNLNVSQRINNEDVPILKFVVESLGTEVKVRTYDMTVEAYLGGIYLQHLKFKASDPLAGQLADVMATNAGPLINLINTPVSDDTRFKLLTVFFVKANPDGPKFASMYESTEQSIDVTFSCLEVLCHQEALMNIHGFVMDLLPALMPPEDKQTKASGDKTKDKEKKVVKKKKLKLKDPNIIDVRLRARLDLFSLAMCNEDRLLTDIKIKGIDTGVSVQQAKTTVTAMLKDITIYDPHPASLYPKIVEIVGTEVLKLDITVFNDATKGDLYSDMSAVDTRVQVAVGQLKVVFLNKFVTDLVTFAGKFEFTKEQISKAGDTLAEYSSEAVQNIQETVARISLDVSMKAPMIIIPQSSKSSNVLIADLGTLKLGNAFHMSGDASPSGVRAVLDKMNIELTQLQLKRCSMGKRNVISAECLLIEPVTISLSICRNLAAAWYHEVPDIDISGKLKAVVTRLSQGDFTMMMKLLNENLTEGQTPAPKVPAVEAPGITAAIEGPIQSETSPRTSAAVSQSTTVDGPTTPTSKELFTKLKFNFYVESISATLYTGETNMSGGIATRDAKTSLGRIELQLIAVEGQMMSDESLATKVILKDTVLEDTRPPRQNGVTRMVKRSFSELQDAEKSNMIDVNFNQDDKKNKTVDIKVNNIHLCVCLEYLMAVGDFFVKGLPPSPQATVVREDGTTAPVTREAPPPEGDTVLLLSVIKPEIVLIEDPNNLSSNALYLSMEVVFKMRITPEIQTMDGSVRDLQIVSCIYNKRHQNSSQILPPCEISLHSSAPYGRGHHIDIITTDIILDISPATIRTMAAISANMGAKPQEEEGEKKSLVPPHLWAVKKISECEFWFLKSVDVDIAVDQERFPEPPLDDTELSSRGEMGDVHPKLQLMMSVPSIVIKLEGGVGDRTVPLLIVESTFQGEVKDWSGKLNVSCSLNMEVAYYNEKLAVWEPLLEPVENQKGGHRRWDLGLEIEMNDDLPMSVDDVDGDAVDLVLPPPKMSISIRSEDTLLITISKTCLEVLTNLGKAFGDAYRLDDSSSKVGDVLAPYLIQNQTGMSVLLKLDNSLELPDDAEIVEEKKPAEAVSGRVRLPNKGRLELYDKKSTSVVINKASIIKSTQEGQERKMLFQVEQFGAAREVIIKRAEKRLFEINQKTYPGSTWGIVVDTATSYGRRTVTLRSLVQVMNHLSYSIRVFYRGDNNTERCGICTSGDVFNIPLHAVYCNSSELHFSPDDDRYQISSEPINWRVAENKGMYQLKCPGQAGHTPFYINVRPEIDHIYSESGNEMTAKAYIFHLHPTVILHNLLPFNILCLLEGTEDDIYLEGGQNTPIYNASIGESSLELRVPNYHDVEWIGRRSLEMNIPELSVWTVEGYQGATKFTMDLGLHCKVDGGSLDVSIFSPYWMINKTGINLYYKGSDDEAISHRENNFDNIILFSFKTKSFLGKKKDKKEVNSAKPTTGKVKQWKQSGKACLRTEETDWSDKFSLDTVGSAGTIQCKSKKQMYEMGVKIILSSSGLTKIVTFTPFYMMLNTAEYSILCSEVFEGTDDWFEVKPDQFKPFWPIQNCKQMKMKVKVKGQNVDTGAFCFNQAHTTLMKLEQYGGISVECQVTESAMVTKLSAYKKGMAPIHIVNHTDLCDITIYQSGIKKLHTVGVQSALLYTWEDALGKRELVWSCGQKKDVKNDLTQDGISDFFVDSDNKVYWVSFLDGMQRVLLFTQDIALATIAQEAGELERIEQEISVYIQGMGLSLVNNDNQTEVGFLGITSSGVIWEEKKKRFKAFNMKTCTILEMAYQRYCNAIELGKNVQGRFILENKMDVDFQEMMMWKPTKRLIRRSFQDGIWLQYKTSPHQVQLHAKINKLQLDNQLSGAVFPTVLAPIPPPKSVAAESVPKPFTEVSMMMRKHEHSDLVQFKYFKVLIQEMSFKLDQGFLNAVLELFASDAAVSREQETKQFESDCKNVETELITEVGLSLAEEQKNFYDYLHFSPIKIHLSFSLQGGGDGNKPTQIHANIINIFLQSVGVVLTDVQDVVFKLGYFERSHKFYNQSQLTGEFGRHYAGQAIKQMYVLVLGLDVLGNPFGLLRGLGEGIEDLFYEPYQGAIQGPEEFAEGLALGVRSLFGHAVGGAAGAVSRITGTLGKGIAALTLDDEYQKKRREAMNKRPANIREGLARGGKGLVMGVFDGVTGIVRKPIEGAQKEGVEGFFKGIGKGLIGVVTRPTSGVIDFASSSFEGIRRIAELSDEVGRIRPPRRFHSDKIIRPYNHQEAEGYAILQETEKGKFLQTDEYVAHVVVTKDRKNVFLVTDLRVIFASRGEIFGHWDCEWSYLWGELKEKPKVTAKGFEIVLKLDYVEVEEKEKKKFLFGGGSSKKEVTIGRPEIAEWIVAKMHGAIARQK